VTVYFMDFVRVLTRRWYVLFAGLVLMGAAAVGVIMVVPTNYQASGNVLILLPPTGTTDKPVNPYLNTPAGLNMAAIIVGGVVTTPEAQRDVKAAGFTSEFAVGQSPGTGVPLLNVTGEDTNPTMAVAPHDEAIRRLKRQRETMQADVGAPRDQRMVAQTFSVTTQAEAVAGAKARALAAVGAVGVVLTLIATFAVDRWRRKSPKNGRRLLRRAERRPAPEATEPPRAPVPEEKVRRHGRHEVPKESTQTPDSVTTPVAS